ncbi:MAG: HWE histidine kinase domain-containing protein [Rhizobium rhizophilum]|uniref:HWE histidine kinase domain-containing protein n=1 Tax=Rhizobium rhizophilum TaxID=1850373 RepID=UPI00391C0B55
MRAFLHRLPAFASVQEQLSPSGRIATYVASIIVFAIALAIRAWFDPVLPAGFPFLTFFPAVIICGFVFGLRQGLLVAVLSGLSAWYFFISPGRFDFTIGTLLAMGLYLFVVATDLTLVYLITRAYRQEITTREEIQRLAEQQEVMAQELDHRLKNIFATINAIISLSLKNASSADELAARLRDRLTALGRSNLLLRGLREGEDASLQSVVFQALEPFAIVDTARFSSDGPRVPIGGQTVVVLSLILHELGTNAAKYGALSVPGGHVALNWSIEASADTGEQLVVIWRESGGPVPTPPLAGAGGFGSTLMKRVIAGVRGQTEMTYPETGAMIRMTLPVDMLRPTEEPTAEH